MRQVSRSPAFDEQAIGLGLRPFQVEEIVGAIQFQERMSGLPPPTRPVKLAVPGASRNAALPRHVWVEFSASVSEVRLIAIRAQPY